MGIKKPFRIVCRKKVKCFDKLNIEIYEKLVGVSLWSCYFYLITKGIDFNFVSPLGDGYFGWGPEQITWKHCHYNLGGKGHWADYYTSPQSFISSFSYWLA